LLSNFDKNMTLTANMVCLFLNKRKAQDNYKQEIENNLHEIVIILRTAENKKELQKGGVRQ